MFPSDTGMILRKWHWLTCSQERKVRLVQSETDPIVLDWHWYQVKIPEPLQMRLAQLFPSDTGTVGCKRHWNDCSQWHLHNCSQVVLAKFFPSETGTIFPKWHALLRLFSSDTGKIFPKWHWYNCSQVRL